MIPHEPQNPHQGHNRFHAAPPTPKPIQKVPLAPVGSIWIWLIVGFALVVVINLVIAYH
jgi:hypothetical protein